MNTKSKSFLLKSGLFVVVGWFAGTACFPLPFVSVERPAVSPQEAGLRPLPPLCSDVNPESSPPTQTPEIPIPCRPEALTTSSAEPTPETTPTPSTNAFSAPLASN